MLTLALSVLLASAPALAAPPFDFSGQGIPRADEAHCQQAGAALARALGDRAFQTVTVDHPCPETSADIGGFVPVVRAKHDHHWRTQQVIGSQAPNRDACAQELQRLKSRIPPDQIVEAECLDGRSTDWRGRATTYSQAWITKLIDLDDKSHAIEADRRDSKAVSGSRGASTATPSASKAPQPAR